jgi:hypothetical protein
MPTVDITNSRIVAFATAVALVVPLFIIAILVDSSKDARRIGSVNDDDRSPDKSSIRQSRRTLLAMAVGLVVEISSLNTILTLNPDAEHVRGTAYSYLFFNSAGILVLFYVAFIPHIELHMSNIRNDPGTARWSIVVGWLVDTGLIVYAVITRFIAGSKFNHEVSYIFFGLGLIFTGSMITLTINTVRHGRLRAHSPSNQQKES